MARPTLSSHPKFARLAHRLGSRAMARGSLELIWEAAYASGEALLGDADTVEALADWRGTRGELVAALAAPPAFLDRVVPVGDAPGRELFAVHDLEDHAPDYVAKRWKRELERRQNGQTIRSLRQRAANSRHANGGHSPDEDRSEDDQRPDGDQQTESDVQSEGSKRLQTSLTPAPAPAPNTDQVGASTGDHSQHEDRSQRTTAAGGEAAPRPSPPSPREVLLEIPCVSGKPGNRGPLVWKLTGAIVSQFQEAFPGYDILGAGRRLRLHLETNPGKRKTHAGTQEYLRRWVTREVERGGPIVLAPEAAGPRRAQRQVDDQVRAVDAKVRELRGTRPMTPEQQAEMHATIEADRAAKRGAAR